MVAMVSSWPSEAEATDNPVPAAIGRIAQRAQQPPARAALCLHVSEPRSVSNSPARTKPYGLAARALRCTAMSVALVLVIVVALLVRRTADAIRHPLGRATLRRW
jgi:hypothetical protein